MNTFGMKVKARCFIEYDSVADLVDIEFEELARPVLHIGGGSNLLFTDDFKGTVLHSKINFIEILNPSLERRISAVPSASARCSKNMEAAVAPVNAIQSIDGMPPRGLSQRDWGVDSNAPTETVFVSVGAGVVFDDFCEWAAKEGLWGVENLSYIPGEVGASAVQNIGAYGVEVKDVIRTVYCYDTVDEEFVNFDVEDLDYGYRDSAFKDPEIKGRYIVTHVVFALSRTPQPKLDYGHLRDAVASAYDESRGGGVEKLNPSHDKSWAPPVHEATGGHGFSNHPHVTSPEDVNTYSDCVQGLTPALIRKVIIKIRKEKLPEPSLMGSAGSFFKNPVISAEHFARIESAAKAEHGADYKVPHYDLPDGTVKVPAAWMIEQCGWKGRRSGGAAVYDKQPLVIVNYSGDAYPEEIVSLERRIMDSVKHKFDVELHPEVEHI